jgi:hypothetical protein
VKSIWIELFILFIPITICLFNFNSNNSLQLMTHQSKKRSHDNLSSNVSDTATVSSMIVKVKINKLVVFILLNVYILVLKEALTLIVY